MKQSNAFLLTFLSLAFLFGFISTSWSQEKAEEWFLKGNTLSSQNRFEDAVEAYKKSIEKNPNATVAYFNLGLAHKNLNQLEEASIAFKKTIQLEPANLDARYSLGNIYNHLNRWEDAIAQLNIVVHRRRDDAEAHGNLGWAYFNFKKGPPFKYLVIINLTKAVGLFESKNQLRAADATRKVLEEARNKFDLQENY